MAYHQQSMYSNTDDCYDGGRHGGQRMYSRTDECYDDVERYNGGGGYGGQQRQVYSEDSSYSRGYGGMGEQGYDYKREEKQHKNREHLGEVGALAGGAFALYEGHRAKVDPTHARKHQIEAGVAGAAALGAGGYAFHEHREHKETSRYDGGGRPEHRHGGHHHGYCTN